MKKRIMGVLLAAICAIGLIGCGNTNNSDTSAKKEDTTKASYIVRIGMPTAGKHFQNFTAEQYKETIEKAFTYTIVDVLSKPFNEMNVRRVITSMENFK